MTRKPLILITIILAFITCLCFHIWIKAHNEDVAIVSTIPMVEPLEPVYPDTPITPLFPVSNIPRVESDDMEAIQFALNNAKARFEAIESLSKAIANFNYEENHPIYSWILLESKYAQEDIDFYIQRLEYLIQEQERIEKEKWIARMEEYPVATTIWLYLKDLGYSDYVCAGILGNIMAEVGGQTLKIQYELYDKSGKYYGICQWSNAYYPQVHGTTLDYQLNFLRDTIQKEFKIFGYIYQNGFTYDKFLQLTDEEAAAMAFAKVYERCGSGSYSVRQKNAKKAYNYFVN